MFSPKNKIQIGIKCMAFLDWTQNNRVSGSRYVFGEIITVSKNKVEIKITRSNWPDCRAGDMIELDKCQIWAWAEDVCVIQQNLFEG